MPHGEELSRAECNPINTGDVPSITAMNKTAAGPISPGSAPDFSYQLLDPNTISNNGIEVARTGTVASGSVTITTKLPGITGSSGETWAFNGIDLGLDVEFVGSGNAAAKAAAYVRKAVAIR